jgi:PIN domain nuclease of toxin-antitoxin system
LISVVDSSVVLAIVRGETGEENALRLALGATMSAVNVAEVVTKCIEKDYPEEAALQVIQSCGIEIVPLDEATAILAGRLRRNASKGVLSLGDRACLALAIRNKAIAVTADRAWADLDLPCKIELIR